jgi:hypothetical protein
MKGEKVMITLTTLLIILGMLAACILVIFLIGGVTGLGIVLDIMVAAFIISLLIKVITGK